MPPTPIIFNDTTPAAPGTDINVKWQTDSSGNLSAHVPASGGGGSGAPSGTFHSVVVNAFGLGGNGSQLGAAAVSVGSISGPFSASDNVALPWYRLESTGSPSGITDDIFVTSPATIQQMQFYVGIGSGLLGSGVLTGCRWWLGFSDLGIGSLDATNPAGHIVGFRLDQSGGLNTPDTNWQAYVSTDATHYTVVDTGVAPNPYISSGPPPYGDVTDQFKITQDGAGGWNFYIDGTKVANIPSGSTGLPPANTQMIYVAETDAQSSYTSQLFHHSTQWWSVY